MGYAPIIFISAQTGYNVNKLMQLIRDVDAQNGARVPTGVLNEMLARATARMQPPSDKGRRLKIFYLTQASTRPPTFVAFVNAKHLFHFSYQRYLINQIRENFGLEHTPIRLVIRERGTGERRRKRCVTGEAAVDDDLLHRSGCRCARPTCWAAWTPASWSASTCTTMMSAITAAVPPV